jgi:hypothetical protein
MTYIGVWLDQLSISMEQECYGTIKFPSRYATRILAVTNTSMYGIVLYNRSRICVRDIIKKKIKQPHDSRVLYHSRIECNGLYVTCPVRRADCTTPDKA